MKEWTEDKLTAEGYELQNAKIKDVSLDMYDYGLALRLTLEGCDWDKGGLGMAKVLDFIGVKYDSI